MLWIWTLKPDFGFNCCQASESRQIANFFDLLYILIGKMGKIIFVFNEVTMYVICQLPGQMLLWNVYFHEKRYLEISQKNIYVGIHQYKTIPYPISSKANQSYYLRQYRLL